MRPIHKAAIAVGVLVLAAAVAVLPRLGDGPRQPSDDVDMAAVTEARQAANLPPCPHREPGAGTVEALRGVTATCLADGSTVKLGKALAGEVTLINLWATWCAPCREELPVLEAYSRRPDAARVLTVQVNSGMAAGLRMLAELGVTLPAVYDGNGVRGPVRDALDVPRTLPATYVVSADGTVRFVEKPRVLHSVRQVREVVAEYGGGR